MSRRDGQTVSPLCLAVLPENLEVRSLLSATTVQLTASNDTTIYDVPAGDLANGAGEFLLAGGAVSQGGARRGIVYFDLSSVQIPDGATIIDVVLSMNLAETLGGAASVSVHRVLSAWGEAGSDAPGSEVDGAAAHQFDATWLYSFFDGSAWGNPGGDFAGASASTTVNEPGIYEWVGGDLIGDVQSWLDQTASNFGWMIIGNESAGNNKSFDSRNSPNAVLRPTLEITWEASVLPGIVEGRKWHDVSADGIRIPVAVDNLNLEVHAGNWYHNAYGGGEYWMRSGTDQKWYFLTSTGELTRWNGAAGQLTGQSVARLDPRSYNSVSELVRSDRAAEPWMNGFSFELLDPSGQVVATAVSQDIDRNGDGVIQEELERGWYRFEDVAPGNYTVREVPAAGWVQSAGRYSPLAAQSYDLKQSLGLHRAASLHVNYGGLGEKWLKATDGWYYIVPTGEVYQWDGVPVSASNPLSGSITARLDHSYFRDPSLIYASLSPVIAVSPGLTVSNVEIGNYQPAVISGRKWHDRNPDGIRNPPELRYVDLSVESAGDESTGGHYSSDDGSQEYYIDSNGQVYETGAGGLRTAIATVSGAAFDDGTPGRWVFFEEPWLNGWTFELLDEAGNVIDSRTSDDIDLNGNGTIETEEETGWYIFDNVLPGTYTVREVQQSGWIQTAPASPDYASLVTQLQQQYGFKTATRDYYNFGARNERWLQGRNNEWYFITPDGRLYEWNRNSGGALGPSNGTQIARLSSSFYLNPSLLANPVGTSVTVDGGEVIDNLNFGNHHVLDGVFVELEDVLLANG